MKKRLSTKLLLILLGLLLQMFILSSAKSISFWTEPIQITDNNVDDQNPSISSDGSTIAFETFPSDDYSEISVVYFDGSEWGTPTQLTNNNDLDFDPSISGDGSTIAFASNMGNVFELPEIFVVNFNGYGWGTPTPLTNNNDYDRLPLISDDGSTIAFYYHVNNQIIGDSEIFVVNFDGSTWGTPIHLTPSIEAFGAGEPSISGDGSIVAFVTNTGDQTYGDSEILVVSFDGSEWGTPTYVTRGFEPSVSGDGSTIAFRSQGEIFVVTFDGSAWVAPIQLTHNDFWDSQPSISGDGSTIAFRSHSDLDSEIFVVTFDGSDWSEPIQVTNNDYHDLRPSVSGDGSTIAFQTRVDDDINTPALEGDDEIFVVNLESIQNFHNFFRIVIDDADEDYLSIALGRRDYLTRELLWTYEGQFVGQPLPDGKIEYIIPFKTAEVLPENQITSLFVEATGWSGTLTEFSVTCLGKTYTSSDPPVDITISEPGIASVVIQAPPQVLTSTGTGKAAFSTSSGSIQLLSAIDESVLSTAGRPSGIDFPDGLFSFAIIDLTPGQTVTICVELPTSVPVGSEYWKCHKGASPQWFSLPIGSDDGDNIICIQLTDGGAGDSDGIANGEIVDPGGLGTITPNDRIPWEMILTAVTITAIIMAIIIFIVKRNR